MKKLVLLSVVAVLLNGCNAQDKDKNETSNEVQPKPKVSWKVNKEVDENGNIIRYDSTYTWTYSSNGEHVNVNVDSVLNAFNSYFNTQMPGFFDKSIMDPFWNDSLLHKDFLMDDYFYQRFHENFLQMDEMFKRMDSIRNKFFEDHFPGIEQKEKEQK
ncbi:MAG: hypothetical protein Kow0079_05790 [Vicingaceae bacterium]